MITSIYIDVYGYRAVIRSSSQSALNGLAEDFAFFRRETLSPEHSIELFEDEPHYQALPALGVAAVYTPRNVSYRLGSITVVDYSSRALGIHDRASGDFRVYSRDPDLLYEAAYLFLLSQIGEALDESGLHRLHALALSVENRAALVLLPMGGGKSTLGFHLLHYPAVSLLSDDSPLIDRSGNIHAFPLRIGLLPGAGAHPPADDMRMIQRMEFGPKLLVRYSYFADRVRASATPCLLFIGQRSLDNRCQILPATRRSALRAMLTNCVVGLGLFQGLEFVLTRSPKELLSKARIAGSRLFASIRLLRRSRRYHLILGRDPEENARVVFDFMQAATADEALKTTRQRVESAPEHP